MIRSQSCAHSCVLAAWLLCFLRSSTASPIPLQDVSKLPTASESTSSHGNGSELAVFWTFALLSFLATLPLSVILVKWASLSNRQASTLEPPHIEESELSCSTPPTDDNSLALHKMNDDEVYEPGSLVMYQEPGPRLSHQAQMEMIHRCRRRNLSSRLPLSSRQRLNLDPHQSGCLRPTPKRKSRHAWLLWDPRSECLVAARACKAERDKFRSTYCPTPNYYCPMGYKLHHLSWRDPLACMLDYREISTKKRNKHWPLRVPHVPHAILEEEWRFCRTRALRSSQPPVQLESIVDVYMNSPRSFEAASSLTVVAGISNRREFQDDQLIASFQLILQAEAYFGQGALLLDLFDKQTTVSRRMAAICSELDRTKLESRRASCLFELFGDEIPVSIVRAGCYLRAQPDASLIRVVDLARATNGGFPMPDDVRAENLEAKASTLRDQADETQDPVQANMLGAQAQRLLVQAHKLRSKVVLFDFSDYRAGGASIDLPRSFTTCGVRWSRVACVAYSHTLAHRGLCKYVMFVDKFMAGDGLVYSLHESDNHWWTACAAPPHDSWDLVSTVLYVRDNETPVDCHACSGTTK